MLAPALGAALGVMAVIARHEIILFIMGGVFVVEAFSVIIQVASFKLTGRRVFRMAPLHHHFELKGWPEPRVIVRFWIITVMLVLFGLATLNSDKNDRFTMSADAAKNLIIGLGTTGLSCARYLAARNEAFFVADSRLSLRILMIFNPSFRMSTFSWEGLRKARFFLLSHNRQPRCQFKNAGIDQGQSGGHSNLW